MSLINIIAIFLLAFTVNEDTILPRNEKGQIIYEGEETLGQHTKEEIFTNTLKYFALVGKSGKSKDKANIDYSQYTIDKKGSFLVYTQGLVTPQVHGEISYDVKVEVLEKGYKYTYSNFIFNYYKRNRYGIYAPVKGKTKPLEEEKFAGMQKIWEGHKWKTKEYIENHITTLKNKMAEVPKNQNSTLGGASKD